MHVRSVLIYLRSTSQLSFESWCLASAFHVSAVRPVPKLDPLYPNSDQNAKHSICSGPGVATGSCPWAGRARGGLVGVVDSQRCLCSALGQPVRGPAWRLAALPAREPRSSPGVTCPRGRSVVPSIWVMAILAPTRSGGPLHDSWAASRRQWEVSLCNDSSSTINESAR